MTKTHKTVLRSSLVMLSLLALAVASSGVAQAQECIARAISPGTVRAEGITEQIADIELRCGRPTTTGSLSFGIPDLIDISVELNTNITNEINDTSRAVTIEDIMGTVAERMAAKIPYSGDDSEGIGLVADNLAGRDNVAPNSPIPSTMFVGGDPPAGGKLSADSTTIEWSKIPKANLNLETDSDLGFRLLIKGIRANASSVGDGGDITATVLINSAALPGSPFKVAGVSTGLAIKTKAAKGLQCEDTEAVATVTIQEGFKTGIISQREAKAAVVDDGDTDADETAAAITSMPGDRVVVSFKGIPEGVTVIVPGRVGLAVNDAATDANETLESFELALVKEGSMAGVGKGANGMYPVDLSPSRSGAVMYNIYNASPTVVANEWANLSVTFKWKAGSDTPVIASAEVDVSFSPTSEDGGDTFDGAGAAAVPRFGATGEYAEVLKINDCTTTLLYPFVTNKARFDTGIAITNTSGEAGSCAIDFYRDGDVDTSTEEEIGAKDYETFLVSEEAEGFEGYIIATCGFRKARGFAFLIDGYGGVATLAQSYLAECSGQC